MNEPSYTPFFCEENVWQRCRAHSEGYAVFVSNESRACPMWNQRAGEPDQPVFWDYHVVYLDGEFRVWDADSRLGMPLTRAAWIAGTFPHAARTPVEYLPRFRVLTSAEMLARFASDRSHMRGPNGSWLQPPPPYPAIVLPDASMTLPALWDVNVDPQSWIELEELLHYGG